MGNTCTVKNETPYVFSYCFSYQVRLNDVREHYYINPHDTRVINQDGFPCQLYIKYGNQSQDDTRHHSDLNSSYNGINNPIFTIRETGANRSFFQLIYNGGDSGPTCPNYGKLQEDDIEKKKLEEARREAERKRQQQAERRRQEQIVRERRIQQQIEMECEALEKKQTQFNKKLEMKRKMGMHREKQLQIQRHLVQDGGPPIEYMEIKYVEDRLKNLLNKYGILEDTSLQPASLSERMTALQYKLISAYAQKNKLSVDALQNLDHTFCSETLSLTEHVKLLAALVEVTMTNATVKDTHILTYVKEISEKMYFLFCVLNKLYQESKTMAGNILRRITQMFSDAAKDQLTLILFNGIWDVAQAFTFYMVASHTRASQDKIEKILHQVQTYKPAFDISLSALHPHKPVSFLMAEIRKEQDKDCKTIIQEMRQHGHSDVILNVLKQVLEELMDELPYYTMIGLNAGMKCEAIQLIRAFKPADPNVDDLVRILILLSVAVEDITREPSEDPTKTVSGYFPRATQFASVLTLLLSDSPDGKGCLLEIATGEGKSCIVALFALIQAIRGKTVDIITSSPLLARRDSEEWSKLYEKFGLTCSSIPPPNLQHYSDSRDLDSAIAKAYNSHIVYGTVEDFAADILRQEFEKKTTRNWRKFDIAIVDEVDYMTLDNGIQVTFLSHDATGMRHLDQLLAAIWTRLHNCQRIMDVSGDTFWATGIQYFHKLAVDSIFGQKTEHFNAMQILEAGVELGLIRDEDLREVKMQPSTEDNDLQSKELEKLVSKFGPQQQKDLLQVLGKVLKDSVQFQFYELNNSKACFTGNSCESGEPMRVFLMQDGLACLLMTQKELVDITVQELSLRMKYSDVYSSAELINNKEESFIILPKHLKEYTQNRLPVFVENALLAIIMEKGREYTIDSRGQSESPEYHSIIPIDFQSTGVLEKNKRWGDGLQQFLELKHKLALSQISSVTNFMSNFHFFQRYISGSGIFGVSGTLGGEVDFKFLKKHFKTSCYPMPTHRYTKKLELPVLQVDGGREAWIKEICSLVKIRTSPKWGTEGQCVLVVCEDLKTADELQHKLIKLKSISSPANITLYTRSDKHNVERKTFTPGEVILATNLGGRGTDIKVTKEVNKSGGLSVILTHFPANLRVEKQIFGRTSRKGNPGMVQMVLNLQDLAAAYQGQTVEEMRKLRENYEEKRIADMENDELKEINMRHELFTQFCDHLQGFASSYSFEEKQDIYSRRVTLSEDCQKKTNGCKMDYQPALNSLKETWALWLTTHEKDINDHKAIEPLRDDLRHVLTATSADLLKGKSKNFYDYISVALDRTALHINDKSNDYGTLFYWEQIEETDNMYRAISLYNRAFITINMAKSGYTARALTLLREATAALEIYSCEISNVITFGEVAQSSRFEKHNPETNFTLQTQMKMQLLNSWRTYIKNAEAKLQMIQQNKKNAITKEASVFTLSETMHRSKVEADELALLYDYGLSFVFEVEQKPEFCFDALICFILGGLQVLAGILICGLTCGTASQFALGLISEGVSDMLSGIEGMIKGTFNWAQWAISKAISIAISLATAGFKFLMKAAKEVVKVTKGLVNGTRTFSSLARDIVASGKMALSSATSGIKTVTSSATREAVTKSITGLATNASAKQAMIQATKIVGKTVVKRGIEKALSLAVDKAAKEALKAILRDCFMTEIRKTLDGNQELDKGLQSFIVTQTVPETALQKENPANYVIPSRNKELIKDSVQSLASSAVVLSSSDQTYKNVLLGLRTASDFIMKIADKQISSGSMKIFKLSVCITEYGIQIADIVKSHQINPIINKQIIPHIISGMSDGKSAGGRDDARCKFNDVINLKKEMKQIIAKHVSEQMTELLAEQIVGLMQTTWKTAFVFDKVQDLSNEAQQWLKKMPKKGFEFIQMKYGRNNPMTPESSAQQEALTEQAASYLDRVSEGSLQNVDLELSILTNSDLIEGRGVKVTLVEDGENVSTEYYPGNRSTQTIELHMKKSDQSEKFDFCAVDLEDITASGKWSDLHDAVSQAMGERISGEVIQASIQNEIQQNMDRYLPRVTRELQRPKWNDLADIYLIPGLESDEIIQLIDILTSYRE